MALGFDGSGGIGGSFYAAYKHIYNPKRVAVLAYSNRPLFKELAKRDMFEGDTYNHSIFFEDPQGGSSDFATAIAQKVASSQGARMVLARGREYQAITINNEEVRASRSDTGSLLRKKSHETDRVINEMSRRMDIGLHGQGTGVLASFTTGGSVATNVVTLDTAQLGIRFSVKMYLQVATNNPTNGTQATLLNTGASVQVTARSVSATSTTLTFDQNLNVAFPSIATTTQYFLLRKGDNLGFGTANQTSGGVSGLKSWLPVTAPTNGDNFWGYDRSVDVQRLSGVRYIAANGEKYETTFQNSSAELYLQGANPSVCLVAPVDFAKYSQELGNKVRYEDAPGEGSTGFSTLKIRGQSGDIRLMADPQVDPGTYYMLDMDTFWIAHLDGLPHLDESDGRPAARESTSDAIEIRWRAWFQMVCDAPGKNLVGQFAA